jgi:hypothetical protein
VPDVGQTIKTFPGPLERSENRLPSLWKKDALLRLRITGGRQHPGSRFERHAPRINLVARLSRFLPRTPQDLDSERFQPCTLRFYVLHFKDELHGVFFAWVWWRFDLDALRDLSRNGMEGKTSATSLEGSPRISPALTRRSSRLPPTSLPIPLVPFFQSSLRRRGVRMPHAKEKHTAAP